MASVRIHALEGSMLSHPQGIKKLVSLSENSEERTDVFVLSPVRSPDYQLDGLLTLAAENEEKLWSRLEKSQSIWNELAESSLAESESVQERINASFSDIEEVLRAVWIMKSAPDSAFRYFDGLTSTFLSWILAEAFTSLSLPCSTMSPGTLLIASHFQMELFS